MTDRVRDSGQTFFFGTASSGERVDEKSAMQISTVYACVRLLAETVAGLPLHLYRYTDKGNGKEKAWSIRSTGFSTGSRTGDDKFYLPGDDDDTSITVGECLRADHPGWEEHRPGTVSAAPRECGGGQG